MPDRDQDSSQYLYGNLEYSGFCIAELYQGVTAEMQNLMIQVTGSLPLEGSSVVSSPAQFYEGVGRMEYLAPPGKGYAIKGSVIEELYSNEPGLYPYYDETDTPGYFMGKYLYVEYSSNLYTGEAEAKIVVGAEMDAEIEPGYDTTPIVMTVSGLGEIAIALTGEKPDSFFYQYRHIGYGLFGDCEVELVDFEPAKPTLKVINFPKPSPKIEVVELPKRNFLPIYGFGELLSLPPLENSFYERHHTVQFNFNGRTPSEQISRAEWYMRRFNTNLMHRLTFGRLVALDFAGLDVSLDKAIEIGTSTATLEGPDLVKHLNEWFRGHDCKCLKLEELPRIAELRTRPQYEA